MYGEDRAAQKGKKARQKESRRRRKCAPSHFLCKDVRGIDLSSDMSNLKSFILHPFSNGVVTEFDMAGSLRCHVVRPLDARFIVVVKDCWSVGVRDRIT
jgi:hypothetical protein